MVSLTGRAIGWAALAAIAALIVWGLMTPWGLALDFANFYDAGHKAAVGAFAALYDPRALIDGKPPLGNMTFFSAPITAFFYAPLAALSPHAATFAFKLLGTLANVAGLVILYRQTRPRLADPGYFTLFIVAALLFQPFWTIYRVGGQTTPFVFLLLVLAHGTCLRGRMVATALLFSVVVLIKPVFAPAAILLFIMAGNRFRVTALTAAVVTGALSLAVFGLDLHREFLARVLEEGTNQLEPWMNSGPFSWIDPLFVAPDSYATPAVLPAAPRLTGLVLRVLVSLGLIATMIWHLRQGIGTVARRHVIYVTGLLLVIGFSPVVWAHYLVVLFIPLAYLLAGRDRLAAGSRWAFAAVPVLAVFQSLILLRQIEMHMGFDTTGKILAIGLVKSLPALVFTAAWMASRRGVHRILVTMD